jgi:radical SAM superfamily enzyme YgiQ (UPF0313 family)
LNILFATPPVTSAERYGELKGAGSSAPALGILLLAAMARNAGHKVSVLDAAALNLSTEAILQKLTAESFDLLAISATTLGINAAEQLASSARRVCPAIKTVLGGPHVSAVPEQTLEVCPGIDIAVVGEGEETFLFLLEALAEGNDLASVAGLVFRDGKRIRSNSRRPFITRLDELPYPAWDLLTGFPDNYSPAAFKTLQTPATSIVTSRGCPNECIFCDRSVFGQSCHAHSANYVVSMIRHLHDNFGIKEFCFEDDTFITFKQRLVDICQQLIDLNLGITWSCLGRVNHVTAENLHLMQQAGCWQISYGIESGNQQILENIHKKVSLEQIRNAVVLTRAAGIRAKGFFIIGHPGETAATIEETRNFALELPLNDISVSLLTPFPATELAERSTEFGHFDADWSKMNLLNAVFVPFGLTQQELLTAQKNLLKGFYRRPKIWFDYGTRLLRNPTMLGSLLSGFRALRRSTE